MLAGTRMVLVRETEMGLGYAYLLHFENTWLWYHTSKGRIWGLTVIVISLRMNLQELYWNWTWRLKLKIMSKGNSIDRKQDLQRKERLNEKIWLQQRVKQILKLTYAAIMGAECQIILQSNVLLFSLHITLCSETIAFYLSFLSSWENISWLW